MAGQRGDPKSVDGRGRNENGTREGAECVEPVVGGPTQLFGRLQLLKRHAWLR